MPFNLLSFHMSTRKARSVQTGVLLISFLSAAWAASGANRTERLEAAATWMYQLGGLEEPAAVTMLAATDYSLLVIEPGNHHRPCTEDFNPEDFGIPDDRADEACADVYPTADIIAELRTTPSGRERLLLAYIDIGQAEWYRDYWIEGWSPPSADGPGRPSFLLAADPDGWSGNFVVAYWDNAWRELWLGEDEQSGLIAELAELGFDGVYLDWVEAYDDDGVRAAAQESDINPAEAMVDFIADIRAAGRAVIPDFLVVAQNAPFLPDDIEDAERYFAAIDALAVEDTWYFGNGEAEDWNAGDGDVGPYDISDRLDCEASLCMTSILSPDNVCANPIETASCLETYPVSGDLHGGDRHACTPGAEGTSDCWSTESRLQMIERYRIQGLPVFTVDYCISHDKAATVYQNSIRHGYRPLVTRVQLSRLTETPPEDFLPDGLSIYQDARAETLHLSGSPGRMVKRLDYGGEDWYTILPSLVGDLLIVDRQESEFHLPVGITVEETLFAADGVRFTLDELEVTFLGEIASSAFILGGEPLDPNGGRRLDFVGLAAVFGVKLPGTGAQPEMGTLTGTIDSDGNLVADRRQPLLQPNKRPDSPIQQLKPDNWR